MGRAVRHNVFCTAVLSRSLAYQLAHTCMIVRASAAKGSPCPGETTVGSVLCLPSHELCFGFCLGFATKRTVLFGILSFHHRARAQESEGKTSGPTPFATATVALGWAPNLTPFASATGLTQTVRRHLRPSPAKQEVGLLRWRPTYPNNLTQKQHSSKPA